MRYASIIQLRQLSQNMSRCHFHRSCIFLVLWFLYFGLIANRNAAAGDNHATIQGQEEQGAIHSILDWDIDDQSRIGFYRMDGGSDATFVLVDAEATILNEIPLPRYESRHSLSNVRWLANDRWIVYASETKWDGKTTIWLVDTSSSVVKEFATLDCPRVQSLAPDHRGGFVVYRTVSVPTESGYSHFQYGEIIAFDEAANERWRTSGKGQSGRDRLVFSASIAVTTDGRIVLYNQNDHDLMIFDIDGAFERRVESGALRHCVPNSINVHPACDGNVITTPQYGTSTSHLIVLHDSEGNEPNQIETSDLRFKREQRSSVFGYLKRAINPCAQNDQETIDFRDARVAANGTIWVRSHETFFKLDENDQVELSLQEGKRVQPGGRSNASQSDESEKSSARIKKAIDANPEHGPAADKLPPVVNIGRFVEQPLTDEQIRNILIDVESNSPKGSQVWFIGVQRSYVRNDQSEFSVDVYFTPERQKARIRHGFFVTINTVADKHRRQFQQALNAGSESSVARRHPMPYCQISPVDSQFGESLLVPSGNELPFTTPVDILEADLIELVDFVRSGPATPKMPGQYPETNQVNRDSSIAMISKTDSGFVVYLGTQEGPLSGIGQVLKCSKSKQGLKLDSIGQWVS